MEVIAGIMKWSVVLRSYCVAKQLTSTFLIKNTNYEIVKLKICMLIIDNYGTLKIFS